jgi:hypothetical protein
VCGCHQHLVGLVFLENRGFISYIMIVHIDHLTRTPLEEQKITATPL